MTTYDLPSRRARYFMLNSELAHMDNSQLRALFDAAEDKHGRRRNHVLDVAGSKVFVKRVPVTDLEYNNLFSTRNHYELPTYFNYGVGSAGFGAFRELVANIKITNWVLEGRTTSFPLLYHYRFIRFEGERPPMDMERHRGYIEYWNSNENIGRFMLDRATAGYELALFMEHIPYVVEPWLREHLDQVGQMLDEMLAAITFLRNNGIVHFDAHFDNMLTDGEHVYLTDFGLVLDERFPLSDDEAAFLKRNTYYDYGEVLASVGFLLFGLHRDFSDDTRQRIISRYGIADGSGATDVFPHLINNIEELIGDGTITLDQGYVDSIVRYRSIVLLFLDFYIGMRKSKAKNIDFPHERLVQFLDETGFLSE